ncbi:MAG: DUF503 domain-containing protein [Acidobacteriota bacterium]
MTIGLCTLEFHLPGCRSLKEKRRFLNSLRGRICNCYNVALSEVDYHDLWQRSVVGIVSISNSREIVDRTFQKILREAEAQARVELISFQMKFL